MPRERPKKWHKKKKENLVLKKKKKPGCSRFSFIALKCPNGFNTETLRWSQASTAVQEEPPKARPEGRV